MPSPRVLSPWYWVMLGTLIVVGLLWVSDQVFRWGISWLSTVAMVTVFVSTIFVFRMMWKQAANPALRRDERREGSQPTESTESESGR
jgi:hypothetical protein